MKKNRKGLLFMFILQLVILLYSWYNPASKEAWDSYLKYILFSGIAVLLFFQFRYYIIKNNRFTLYTGLMIGMLILHFILTGIFAYYLIIILKISLIYEIAIFLILQFIWLIIWVLILIFYDPKMGKGRLS